MDASIRNCKNAMELCCIRTVHGTNLERYIAYKELDYYIYRLAYLRAVRRGKRRANNGTFNRVDSARVDAYSGAMEYSMARNWRLQLKLKVT